MNWLYSCLWHLSSQKQSSISDKTLTMGDVANVGIQNVDQVVRNNIPNRRSSSSSSISSSASTSSELINPIITKSNKSTPKTSRSNEGKNYCGTKMIGCSQTWTIDNFVKVSFCLKTTFVSEFCIFFINFLHSFLLTITVDNTQKWVFCFNFLKVLNFSYSNEFRYFLQSSLRLTNGRVCNFVWTFAHEVKASTTASLSLYFSHQKATANEWSMLKCQSLT